jgi:hypothetical protein
MAPCATRPSRSHEVPRQANLNLHPYSPPNKSAHDPNNPGRRKATLVEEQLLVPSSQLNLYCDLDSLAQRHSLFASAGMTPRLPLEMSVPLRWQQLLAVLRGGMEVLHGLHTGRDNEGR